MTLFFYTPIWFFFIDTRLDELPINELLFHSVYQGLIVSLVSLWLFTKAATSLGPTTTAVFMAAVPGVSLLLSMPVLAEYPTTMNIVGMSITTVGILFASGLALFWLRQLKLKLSSATAG